MEHSELLKPRYKVIAYFPNSDYKIGDVLVFVREVGQAYDYWELHRGGKKLRGVSYNYFHQYPHLFQPLQWWEERKAEDLPEYVTDDIQSEVAQVERFVFGKYPYVIIKAVPPREYCHWPLPYVLPATKEEYDTNPTTQTTQQ